MKRFAIFMLSVMALGGVCRAQGDGFVEVSVGKDMGDIALQLQEVFSYDARDNIYWGNYGNGQPVRGGVSVSAFVGMRKSFAAHWAYEIKGGLFMDTADTHSLDLRVMAGVRYTSPEIWRGVAVYGNVDAGPGMGFTPIKGYLPLELGAGFDIGPRLSVGVNYTPTLVSTNSYYRVKDTGDGVKRRTLIKSPDFLAAKVSFKF